MRRQGRDSSLKRRIKFALHSGICSGQYLGEGSPPASPPNRRARSSSPLGFEERGSDIGIGLAAPDEGEVEDPENTEPRAAADLIDPPPPVGLVRPAPKGAAAGAPGAQQPVTPPKTPPKGHPLHPQPLRLLLARHLQQEDLFLQGPAPLCTSRRHTEHLWQSSARTQLASVCVLPQVT